MKKELIKKWCKTNKKKIIIDKIIIEYIDYDELNKYFESLEPKRPEIKEPKIKKDLPDEYPF